jgi:hypothetical protein
MPSLVQFDRHGKATGVHYDALPPLLLALAQKQQRKVDRLQRQVDAQARELRWLRREVTK